MELVKKASFKHNLESNPPGIGSRKTLLSDVFILNEIKFGASKILFVYRDQEFRDKNL